MSDDLQGGTRSYRPGTWFGIFGAGASVLLPPGEKARVAALWELVDDGAGFDEVLDALISGGLRELPGFVLVSERDGETKVVLRGAAPGHLFGDETRKNAPQNPYGLARRRYCRGDIRANRTGSP